jgi:hypothetical protein
LSLTINLVSVTQPVEPVARPSAVATREIPAPLDAPAFTPATLTAMTAPSAAKTPMAELTPEQQAAVRRAGQPLEVFEVHARDGNLEAKRLVAKYTAEQVAKDVAARNVIEARADDAAGQKVTAARADAADATRKSVDKRAHDADATAGSAIRAQVTVSD